MSKRIFQWSVAVSCLMTFLISCVSEAYAQFDSLGLNTKWSNGSIVLENNSAPLKGLIRFNDKLGMIKFKKSTDGEELSFVETSVIAMQFFDEETRRWRKFAVFNLKEEETGREDALLFEVLMEFRKFALLTRIQRVGIATRARQDAFTGRTYYKKVGYEQFEHLCLVDEEGTTTVVLAVSEFERDKLTLASKLRPYLDKRALEKYLADDWDKFQALVKTNKLNLREREDFIRAFEYLREATDEGS